MAINKSARQQQNNDVVRTLLSTRSGQEQKKEKMLKNLRIDVDLAADFDILCKHLKHSDFSKVVISFIESEVYDNCEEIERIKKALDL